jgi:glycosyltransferase involved in cell wall biosynthesis
MTPVVFVTVEDLSKTSGSGIATRELIVGLENAADAPLYVVCPEPNGTLPDRLRVAVDEFRFLPPETDPGNPRWHLREEASTFRVLLKLLRQIDPRVVVTRLSPSTLAPAPLCKAFGVPHVLLIRGWVNSHNDYEQTKFGTVVEQVVRMNVRLSDEVFVAFEELRAWVSQYRGETQSTVEVLPNAVDPELFRPMSVGGTGHRLGIDDGRFVVGFVGSLSKRHELPTLLRAVSRLEGVELVIVGDGDLRTELEDLAAELGILDRAHFEGRVDHGEVPEYIATFDVGYGVVSEGKASNPIKCYEYLACERPVLSSRSSEMTFIEEMNAGYLVDTVTTEAVVEGIRELREAQDRQSMGVRGRRYVIEHATWEQVGRELLSSVPG